MMNILKIKELTEIRQKIDISPEDELAFVNYFLNDEHENYQCYNIAESVISVIDNSEIPAWTLSRKHCAINKQDLSSVLNTVIELKERSKLNQFFTLLSDNEIDTYKSLLCDRYQCYLEHIVDPGKFTGYENIDHDVLSYTIYDERMFVFLWVLKNEFRIN